MADVCFQFGPFFRQYGTATGSAVANSNIQVAIPSSTNANLYTGALAAGDVKVSKDGGAEGNITALPTQIGATGVWVFSLTALELTCSTITIHVKKSASTAEVVITVETRLIVGQLVADASAIPGNNAGVSAVGIGTSYGLQLGGASAVFYSNVFNTLEAAEPSGAPPASLTFGQMMQYLFARFFQLVTQTVSTQTVFKRDSVTALTNETVADDGTTQSKGKAV